MADLRFLSEADGHVDVFPSSEAVTGYVEAIDVENGEYVGVFDSDARVYELRVVSRRRHNVFFAPCVIDDVAVYPTDQHDPLAFRAMLDKAVPAVAALPTSALPRTVADIAVRALGVSQ